jgi:hypothetical protein
LIAASGFGVFVVDLAPEDFAGEHFLFCNAGAALLGLTLLQPGRPTPEAEGLLMVRVSA